MQNLTAKQESILRFIEEYQDDYSMSPTYQQIQQHFGFVSRHAVQKHLGALIKKGFLRAVIDSNGRCRSLVSVRQHDTGIPLLGAIAAGKPIEAIENIQSTLDLATLGINNNSQQYFALTVKGNSMINAHIMSGDIVIIKKQPQVDGNDIAAVLVDGDATLKYVRWVGGKVLLVPANDTMEPVVIDPGQVAEFSVLGKVVKIIRSY